MKKELWQLRDEIKTNKIGCIDGSQYGATNPSGYINLNIDRWGYSRLHRLVYSIYNGELLPGDIVRHTCDNPRCVQPKHLLKGTRADNVQDMVERGRHNPVKSSLNGKTKLSEDDIKQIRRLSKKLTQKEIAVMFNVHNSHISRIISKERR